MTLIAAPHSWEFRALQGDEGDPREAESGHVVGASGIIRGAFKAEHDFGRTLSSVAAIGDIESNESGYSYLLSVQSPLGQIEQDEDIGAAGRFTQRQAFRKDSPNATLTLTISDVYLYTYDANPFDPDAKQCGDWNYANDPIYGPYHCWTLMWAETSLQLQAFDLTGAMHWRGEGTAVLRGYLQNWEHFAYPRPWGADQAVISESDLDYRELDGAIPEMAAEVSLKAPRRIQIPLDNVPLHGNFMLLTTARVVAYNRRQGESVVTAYFKDPQSTGGIEVTYDGLEPIEPWTDTAPDFPEPPPPVCSTGTSTDAGSVQFGMPAVDVSEANIAARVPITRTGGKQGELLVKLRTSGGTASATDYTAQDTWVYFEDGDDQAHDVYIPVKDNAVEEPSRTVNLGLSELHGCGVIGAPASVLMTILDDDAPPPPPPASYSVGGEVTGLVGTGLILHDRGEFADEVIAANGPYAFDNTRLPGTNYDVRVMQQPSNPLQECTVSNATGTVGSMAVNDVDVSCITPGLEFGLDPTFGTGGKVVDDSRGSAVALQSDGRIVVANALFGAARLTRYLANGSLDATFGAGGHVDVPLEGGINDVLNKLIVQPDGMILASGISLSHVSHSDDFVVLRFNSDGTPDAGFGSNGRVLTDFGVQGQDRARDMVLQPDGKIVLVGAEAHATGGVYAESNFAAARYNADGTLDSGFGTGGLAVSKLANYALNGTAAVLQPDGTLVIAGQARPNSGSFQDTALTRLLLNGSVDTTFGASGLFRANLSPGNDDFATDALLMPDGTVVVSLFAGSNGSRDFTLARFTAAGALDLSFNGTGYRSTSLGAANDIARHLALDANGKIIAAGDTSETIYQNGGDLVVARFNVDGSIDATFGNDGAVKANFYGGDDSADGGVAVQPDGNIVAVGVAVSGSVPKLGMVRVLPIGRTMPR